MARVFAVGRSATDLDITTGEGNIQIMGIELGHFSIGIRGSLKQVLMEPVQGGLSTVGVSDDANFVNVGDISTVGTAGEEIIGRESDR